ncbi:MAG: LVIVD repeat-containing protein [Solirubrobacteraceae bacterium]
MQRVLTALVGALTIGVLSSGVASAHDPRDERPNRAMSPSGIHVPLVTSPGVRLVDNFPETQGISGEFAKTGDFFYVSSLDSISVFDTSDPLHPKLTGTLPNLVFENEAMTYGERKVDGELKRFVLVGNDLYNVAVDPAAGPQRGRVGGGEVIVVDVTDETTPHVRARTPAAGAGTVTSSTHTVQCLTAACNFAYTAGDVGEFSIIDLRDLDNPVQIATAKSPASAPNAIFTRGSGHYWDFDAAGVGWHTGSGGSVAFDVSDPLAPKALNATNEQGTATPWNDFIHHNSMRPNAGRFRAGSPSVRNGNVLLVTEEDYFNDGDELACERAGTFQTWRIPDLDGAAYRSGNPDLAPNAGTIEPLDLINPVALGDGLSTPVGGFCSAHWFDYHQSGIIAQGYYQQGLRLIDVRNATDLRQYGYVTGGASEVWDAYFVPQRNRKGVATGKKTNVVYTADLVRGVDVYEVDLPGADLSEDGPLPPILP